MRTPAATERNGAPAATRHPRPAERAESHATVAEQAQRSQEVLQDLAPVCDRLGAVVLAGG